MAHRLPAARLAQMHRYIEEHAHASVVELSEAFDVSQDTVRRDVEKLAQKGLVSRTHGGVVVARDLTGLTTAHDRRESENVEAKKVLGGLAANLVADGETILVSGGTTTVEVVKALRPRRRLTIVTNSLIIPPSVPSEAVEEILVVGGRYSDTTRSTSGPLALPGLSRLVADRAFVSVAGISAEGGFSVPNADDAMRVGAMIAHARVPVVVADSSKFGKDVFAQVASFDQISVLVTDAMPQGDLKARLDEAGVRIIIPR